MWGRIPVWPFSIGALGKVGPASAGTLRDGAVGSLRGSPAYLPVRQAGTHEIAGSNPAPAIMADDLDSTISVMWSST